MARTALRPVDIAPAFWARPEVTAVLAGRDVGQLFRLVQRETGATQSQLGVVTGLSQAQISEIMSGSRRVASVDVLARIADGFRIPAAACLTLFLARQSGAAPTSGSGRDALTVGSGVTAAYASRSAFASAMPVHELFDGATDISAAGLSLNILCQQYSDSRLIDLVNRGTTLRMLLLEPHGEAIRRREQEEHYQPGFLSGLNELNLGILDRVKARLHPDARERMQIRVYDQTIRFNIILVDERVCIAQPYLAHSRGVECPTFVAHRTGQPDCLYDVFAHAFIETWEYGRPYE
jgi:transcriptional regulator with XRE-family HTH domain